MARTSRLTAEQIARYVQDAEHTNITDAANRAGISYPYGVKLLYQERHARVNAALAPLGISWVQSEGRGGDPHRLRRERDGATADLTPNDYRFLLRNPIGFLKLNSARIREAWEMSLGGAE